VNYDIRSGANDAMQHLINTGRRRIAHIAGPNTWDSNLRTQVWREWMTQHDLACDETWWCSGDWSVAHGEQAMRNMLMQHPDLDAVLAGNDHIALGAMNMLQKSGRAVPDDVAVIGFDDIPEAKYFTPALSTVALPFAELGAVAMDRVIELISDSKKPHEPASALMPVRFIHRQSAG